MNSLEKLIKCRKEDEEILIADGGSHDGTKEYLAELKRSGKIEYFISEEDYGESHALNKLLLIAHGELIKVITDDDVFHYPTIALCRKFMEQHPEIDVVSANGGFKKQGSALLVRPMVSTHEYERWKKNKTPFSFCGLGYIIRKSALPIIGLWNPSFRRADAEYTLRLTSGKANLAWYTGYAYVNISNPQSVSLVYMKKIKDETNRLNKFYLNKNPDSFIFEKLKVLRNKIQSGFFGKKPPSTTIFENHWPEIFENALAWMEEMNKTQKHVFLYDAQ